MERVRKYRVDDDWIDCEIAYLKKRMKFDDSDAVLTTETSVPILFALLEEIKERRESDTSGGVTMERVSDEWLERQLCVGAHVIGNVSLLEIDMKMYKDMVAELLERRQAEAEKPVLPIPCTKGFENWTVKQWFAKINEELDELKEAVGSPMLATPRELYSVTWSDFSDRAIEERCKKIAEEAADTITAITSMLEAMGIGEQKRQAAQKLVNEHNRQRGRC